MEVVSKMNVTFLIGNGFDLGVGLNSRFKDFFPKYKKLSETKEDRIRQFSEEIESDYETWSDFENALGEYTEKFTPETKQNFLDQLKDFETEFTKYLKEQEDDLFFDTSDLICETMKKGLLQFYSTDVLQEVSSEIVKQEVLKKQKENTKYNFVVFNYTSILEKCLACIPDGVVCKRNSSYGARNDTIGNLAYVHGRIGVYPIMGVNDIGQIKNKELAEDKRFAQMITKPLLNEALKMNFDKQATQIISNSSIVCIYGMSLGRTDLKWWQLLMKWLKDGQSRQLVVFCCDKEFSTANQFGWAEKENELIDKLNSFVVNINIENLRSRIHLAMNKNIFEMSIDNYFSRLIKSMDNKEPAIV